MSLEANMEEVKPTPGPAPEKDSGKPKKMGFKQSFKITAGKWYYYLMNSCTAKAKTIKIDQPTDEIHILGNRFHGGGIQPAIQAHPFPVSQVSMNPYSNLPLPPVESSMLIHSIEGPEPENEAVAAKKAELEAEQTRLKAFMLTVVCFTYRSHWKEPISGTNLMSDSGWGCMIRVGQMALANVLIREMIRKQNEFNEDVVNLLLILFNDHMKGEVCPFSIQNIVPLADEKYKIPRGNWFRSTTIMMCLDHLNQIYKPSKTADIVLSTHVDACIFLERIYERVFDESCTNLDAGEIVELLSTRVWPKKLLLTVAAMVGVEEPHPEYKDCLDALFMLPQFAGGLGGSGNRAHFIIGLNKRLNSYYYLDPHYVQVNLCNKENS